MKINGIDVNGLMHEQVVGLIRASREFRNGELVLTIKPNGMEIIFLFILIGIIIILFL